MSNGNTLYVGMDIDLNTFTAQYIDILSTRYSKKKNRFSNNPDGVNELASSISSVAKQNHFSRIAIGYEATNNYGFHLPYYLSDNAHLKQYDLSIYQINPKLIKNFKKSFTEVTKDDDKDAYIISERLKIGKLIPVSTNNSHYMSLRILTRKRFNMVQQLVQEKSRFISNLFIKASAFSQKRVFSDILGNTSASIMTFFNSVEDISKIKLQDMIDFIIQKSKNHFKHPEKIAEKVKYIARESYKPDRVIHDSITYSLLTSFTYIKFLKSQIKDLDKQIASCVETFRNQYRIITSLKGIGAVIAAGIIAELGDLNSFNREDKIAKFAGLVWKTKQSGKFVSEETYLTKSGNKYLRYYLVQAAQLLVTHNPDFGPYYHKKYEESKKHKHKRAILFTARKLIRVLFSLLKKNKLYETPEYLKCH